MHVNQLDRKIKTYGNISLSMFVWIVSKIFFARVKHCCPWPSHCCREFILPRANERKIVYRFLFIEKRNHILIVNRRNRSLKCVYLLCHWEVWDFFHRRNKQTSVGIKRLSKQIQNENEDWEALDQKAKRSTRRSFSSLNFQTSGLGCTLLIILLLEPSRRLESHPKAVSICIFY